MRATKNPIKLNVIFHGPFLFIYYANRVEVVAVAAHGHVVGAGHWLGERPCGLGTYVLNQVSDQTYNEPDPSSHAIIDCQQYPNCQINLDMHPYYRFILPLPCKSTPLATMDTANDIFAGDAAHDIKASTLGTSHALTYSLGANDIPKLWGVRWRPKPSRYQGADTGSGPCPYDFVTNLHVYAETALVLPPNHAVEHFGQMMDMVTNVNLSLNIPHKKFNAPIDDNELGLIAQEQEGLRNLAFSGNVPGSPGRDNRARPPLICDAPSLVILNAPDSD